MVRTVIRFERDWRFSPELDTVWLVPACETPGSMLWRSRQILGDAAKELRNRTESRRTASTSSGASVIPRPRAGPARLAGRRQPGCAGQVGLRAVQHVGPG